MAWHGLMLAPTHRLPATRPAACIQAVSGAQQGPGHQEHRPVQPRLGEEPEPYGGHLQPGKQSPRGRHGGGGGDCAEEGPTRAAAGQWLERRMLIRAPTEVYTLRPSPQETFKVEGLQGRLVFDVLRQACALSAAAPPGGGVHGGCCAAGAWRRLPCRLMEPAPAQHAGHVTGPPPAVCRC
jgi:hypothetical protein